MECSQKSLNKKQLPPQIKLSICLKANVHKQREYIRKDLLISIRKVQSPIKFQNGSNHFQLNSFPHMSFVFVVCLFFLLKNHQSLKTDGYIQIKMGRKVFTRRDSDINEEVKGNSSEQTWKFY